MLLYYEDIRIHLRKTPIGTVHFCMLDYVYSCINNNHKVYERYCISFTKSGPAKAWPAELSEPSLNIVFMVL